MHLKKIAQPLQLFAVLPILTANFVLPIAPFAQENQAPVVVVSESDQNGLLLEKAADNQQLTLKEKAKKIDEYFADLDLPLTGYGKKLVVEAEKNDLPWNLLAAIAMVESTGYKHSCKSVKGKNNGFGWGSCKIAFESIDDAIETVAHNLGGNNPNTRTHYEGKDLKGILAAYNPPKVKPEYYDLVTKVMKTIENYEI